MLETIPEVGTRWLPRCSYSKNNRNFSSHPLASPIGSNFKKCGKKNLNLRHRSLNLKAVSRHICFQCPAELGSLPCPWLKSHLIRAEAWAGFMASTCRGSPRAGEQQISHSMEQAGKAWAGRQVNPFLHTTWAHTDIFTASAGKNPVLRCSQHWGPNSTSAPTAC